MGPMALCLLGSPSPLRGTCYKIFGIFLEFKKKTVCGFYGKKFPLLKEVFWVELDISGKIQLKKKEV